MADGDVVEYDADMNTKSTSTRAEPADLPRGERLPPRHDEVARRARALWEKYGKPVGRDEEIWLEAERELRGISFPTSGGTVRYQSTRTTRQ